MIDIFARADRWAPAVAIDAARAGEPGSGFAAGAGGLQQLAPQTGNQIAGRRAVTDRAVLRGNGRAGPDRRG